MTDERKTTITFLARRAADATMICPRPYELEDGDRIDVADAWVHIYRDDDHVVSFPAHTIAFIASE